MEEFFTAALPFIAIGVTIALVAANYQRGRKNFITEGLCLGLALGAGLAGLLEMEPGLAMSLGMLLGGALGQVFPKKPEQARREETEEQEDPHESH